MSSQAKLFDTREEIKEKVLIFYGKSSQTLQESVKNIREWLEKQKHLPTSKIDEAIIKKFLLLAKYSLEESKKLIDFYYSFRTEFPTIYKHPLSSEMKNTTKLLYFVPIQYYKDGHLHTVMYSKLIETDPKKFEWNLLVAHVLNIYELMIAEDYSETTVSVYDFSGLKTTHFSKVDVPTLKKAHVVLERLFRKKFKCAYITNFPPAWDTFFKLLTSIMNKDVKIIVDEDGSIFAKLVPKEFLPIDLGGTAPSLAERQAVVEKKFVDYKLVFDDLTNAKVKENLRANPSDDNRLFHGLQGSFQKLEID